MTSLTFEVSEIQSLVCKSRTKILLVFRPLPLVCIKEGLFLWWAAWKVDARIADDTPIPRLFRDGLSRQGQSVGDAEFSESKG